MRGKTRLAKPAEETPPRPAAELLRVAWGLCDSTFFPEPCLESPDPQAHTLHMSNKQIVQDLLERLPENVSLHDVAQEIEFVAGVRQGLAELDRGERIPIEEIERELPSWVIK